MNKEKFAIKYLELGNFMSTEGKADSYIVSWNIFMLYFQNGNYADMKTRRPWLDQTQHPISNTGQPQLLLKKAHKPVKEGNNPLSDACLLAIDIQKDSGHHFKHYSSSGP